MADQQLQLILFDDARARNWFPFTLTRRAGELLFGAYTGRARAERVFGARCIGHIAGDALTGFDELDAPPVVTLAEIATTRPRLFLSSRAIPAWNARLTKSSSVPLRLNIAGQDVGVYLPAGEPNPGDVEVRSQKAEVIELPGTVLANVWDLVTHNAEQTAADIAGAPRPSGSAPQGLATIGNGRLLVGQGVRIEPGVVFDLTDGPVWLDDYVTVRACTRLAGPSYVGRNTARLGGPYAAVSIGPWCKIHGEVEETVVLGYSNKAHDGFLGHAYLGKWVNLGALTTNSDLKNNYGTIRMWTTAGDTDTGLIKLGSLLGDHVKTGIGALLNTGTVIGAGSNLYGTDMPPKYVPPFSW